MVATEVVCGEASAPGRRELAVLPSSGGAAAGAVGAVAGALLIGAVEAVRVPASTRPAVLTADVPDVGTER
jgi:hypothetical protein